VLYERSWRPLFVISDDRFEEISEAFVASGFVFAGYLEEQAFELVEAAESVARNGVSEAGSKHDEFVLAFIFGGSGGSTDGVVEAAQGAAGTGIHVAHAGDNDVGLVIEVEAIADELFNFDLGWAVTEGALVRGTSAIAAVAAGAVAAMIRATVSAFTTWTISAGATLTTGTRSAACGTVIACGSGLAFGATFAGRAILARRAILSRCGSGRGLIRLFCLLRSFGRGFFGRLRRGLLLILILVFVSAKCGGY
jgi:hypothetical protein